MRPFRVRVAVLAAGLAFSLPLVGALAQNTGPATTTEPAAKPAGAPSAADRPPATPAVPEGFGRRGGDGATPPSNPNPNPSGGGQMPAEQRKARALAPYEDALPDLTVAQKEEIFQIIEAGTAEMRAARENQSLTEDQRLTLRDKIRAEIPLRALVAMTEPQRAKWKTIQEDLRIQQEGTVTHLGELKGKETREQKRNRLTAGYEPVLEELSVRKKTDVMAALGLEDDAIQLALGNAKLSVSEKAAALDGARAATLKTLQGMLSADQLRQWKQLQESRLRAPIPGPGSPVPASPASANPTAPPKP